jgi:hypothetical protein
MLFRDDECTHCHKVEAWAGIKQVHVIAVVAAAGWDPAALRLEQLNDQFVGSILEEVGTGERQKWKDIADHSPTFESCWTSGNPSL